jgi:hypothetical protein
MHNPNLYSIRNIIFIQVRSTITFLQCFGSGSALDPHSIGFLDPDQGGVKSAEIEGEKEAKRQIIHHKKS